MNTSGLRVRVARQDTARAEAGQPRPAATSPRTRARATRPAPEAGPLRHSRPMIPAHVFQRAIGLSRPRAVRPAAGTRSRLRAAAGLILLGAAAAGCGSAGGEES